MEELAKLKAKEQEALKELIKAYIAYGILTFCFSPEFEMEAEDYCRDAMWKEPA